MKNWIKGGLSEEKEVWRNINNDNIEIVAPSWENKLRERCNVINKDLI